MHLAPIDYVFFGIILVAAIRCAVRGFVSEVLSMAALILGVAAAILFSSSLSVVVEGWIGETAWSQVIAFLAIFIVVYLVVKLLEGLLKKLLDKIRLDKLDHSLGLILGLVEGTILIVLIVFVLQIQPFFDTTKILSGGFLADLILRVFSFESGNIQLKTEETAFLLSGFRLSA